MIDVTFSKANTTFNANFSEGDNSFETDLEENPGGVALDHRRMVGRDAPDQHPIDSITGLGSRLEEFPNESLTNMEIERLLK